jgi:transposase
LAAHIRATAVVSGHPAAAHVVASTVVKLLQAQNLQPHRVPHYLERRDPDFDPKMVRVLHVYEQVELAFDPAHHRPTVRLSDDEKPGMPALGRTAPDRPPQPRVPEAHTWQRDDEYVRQGTRSLLAGLDLATGELLGLVRARHRSAEFIEFLQRLDAHYAPDVKTQIVLDNHSAHTSRETHAYLGTRPNRFEFVFTPKHGSWLNLVKRFFAKLTRQCLRHLRVDSLEEFDTRLLQYLDQLNRDPVPFRWRATAEDLELRELSVI